MAVSAAATTHKDLDWLKRNIDSNSHTFVTDVTNQWAVFGIMGPRSREFLEPLLGISLQSDVFPFGASCEAEIGYWPVRVTRVSFVGEMGWEIYVPVDMAMPVYDRLLQAGKAVELKLAGLHALDSCRIEKKFLHFGHDVADEDTPLEAGVGFVCAMDKAIPFIGHDVIAQQKETGSHFNKRLIQFLVNDPEPLLYHHEPILMNGKTVGYLSSGNYGHTLGGAVGLGYVKLNEKIDKALLESAAWAIDIAGTAYPATASLSALYDPRAERMRA